MKFSVLLPTRNGGKYLGNCISSVLDQSYEDMELIVCDNANTDDTPKVIESFSKDPRLKAFKTEKPVSVIENWNNTLYASSGDYVLMIGDDDFLLSGYFERMEKLIKKYNQPDGITYNGYRYISPEAISKNAPSYYSDPYFDFDSDFRGEEKFPPERLHSIVHDMFRFNVKVPLNTLPHLWSRKVINRVDGDIFRPPYPDHFALNSMMLRADSWVYLPEKWFVIGVTPKSYGHFVFSDDEQKEGAEYLGISQKFEGQLPGNPLVNNMHVWLDLLKENHPEHLTNIRVSRVNYVRHQVFFWVSQYRHGSITLTALLRLLGKLNFLEWMGLVASIVDKKCLKALFSMVTILKASKINTFYYGANVLEGISNIEEFSQWICNKNSTDK